MTALTGSSAAAQFAPFEDFGFYQVDYPLVWERIPLGQEKGDAIGYIKRANKGGPLIIRIHGLGHMREQAGIGVPWLDSHLHLSGFNYWYVGLHHRGKRSSVVKMEKIAEGVADIVRRAGNLGHDPSRIIFVASGWAGLPTALLSTDERWLKTAGVPFEAVRGAVILDGAGFDLDERQSTTDSRRQKQLKELIEDEGGGPRLPSPMTHVQAPNAPAFFLVYDKEEPARAKEIRRFGEAVEAAGSSVTLMDAKTELFGGKERGMYAPRAPKTEPIRLFCENATGFAAET